MAETKTHAIQWRYAQVLSPGRCPTNVQLSENQRNNLFNVESRAYDIQAKPYIWYITFRSFSIFQIQGDQTRNVEICWYPFLSQAFATPSQSKEPHMAVKRAVVVVLDALCISQNITYILANNSTSMQLYTVCNPQHILDY